MHVSILFLFVFLSSCIAAPLAKDATQAFPIIDLGYAKHAPSKINKTTLNSISYATYSNIRFAQPPIGDLRFSAPVTPPPSSEGVQDGVVPLNSTNCLQAIPYYFTFLPGLNGSSWGSEDCLFLDVIVPEGIQRGDNVPVLHWIYGGGYFFGAKDTGGNPAALLDTMTEDEKFIIVASNYRLGALGWMSSDEEPSITKNAGLYDVLAALEWTRDYIQLFGGDSGKVTVMGQSAGAGNIEHFLAASIEGKTVPFNQAILSSPGYRPHVNRSLEMSELYQSFLGLTNCSDIKCLRSSPSDVIAEANRYFYLEAGSDGFPGPSISFGSILDDDLVLRLPEVALQGREKGSTSGGVTRIIAGGMKNDGAASTIGDYHTWEDLLSIFARSPTLSTIIKVQSIYGRFFGQKSSFLPDGNVKMTPYDEFSGDIIYACHAELAARVYSKQLSSAVSSSYRYEMSIQPALHGQDLSYYFYNEALGAADPTINVTIARQFQNQLRRFILGQELEDWSEYSATGVEKPSWVDISSSGFKRVIGEDETDLREKCEAILQLIDDKDDGW